MKKILLFLGAALLSLSITAAPVTPVQKVTKKVQATAVKAPRAEFKASKAEKAHAMLSQETIPATAFQAANNAVPDFNKIAKQKKAYSTLTMKEVGYGVAEATITPAAGTDELLYQIGIMNEDASKVLALLGSFQIDTLIKYFTTTYEVIYTAYTQPKYGTVDPSITSLKLPKGKYIFAILGYAVENEQLASQPSDMAMAQFEITLDGSEYAIKNVNVEVGENSKLNVNWETNTTPVPEGSTYQVRIYTCPDLQLVANSGYELTTTSWSTPDEVTLEENATYKVAVDVWSEAGFAWGEQGSRIITLGTDPKAPTDLVVNVDDQKMQATFTWTNTLGGAYEGNKVYNKVLIEDENGNTYLLNSGYNNTSLATATSEQLPVGKFTWTVMPFYADKYGDWIYITSAKGPNFEVKDVTAPVINSVAIAQISDTLVFLSIDATDNAVGVTAADLKFNVSGDITLENASLEEDGTLKLADLESTKTYQIAITAVDPSGNVSDPVTFEFTPLKDEEAPTNLTAEIAEGDIHERYVVITVDAKDDKASAEQLTYMLIFADETVIEMNAKNGQLVLEGLSPETAYEINVTVKDLGGNVCEDTVKLEFTTLALTPIKLDVDLAQTWIEADYSDPEAGIFDYTFFLAAYDEATESPIAPVIVFDYYPKAKNLLSGTYSSANDNLDERYSSFFPEVYAKGKDLGMSDVTLEIKFLADIAAEGGTRHVYYIYAEWMGKDGNLYYVEDMFSVGVFDENDLLVDKLDSREVFKDTDAPQLLLSEEDPVTVKGTTVDILFLAFDGPFYFEGEIYTEATDLVLEIQTEDGTVLASQAEGTIQNTPTLDEYGDYYFTATLEGLEPETEYTVYIYAKDEAGNEGERIPVTFVTGEKSEEAIDQVIFDIKANKVLHNGQLIIKRDKKAYNVLGAEL